MKKITSLQKLFYILLCITILSVLHQLGDSARAQDLSQKETIDELKKPGAFVYVIQEDVNPEKGEWSMSFFSKTTTVKPAQGVTPKIDEKDYSMTGSGSNWSLNQKAEKNREPRLFHCGHQ